MNSPPHTLRVHPVEVSVRDQLKRLRGALEDGRVLRARLEALENVALTLQAKTPLRETLEQLLFHLRQPIGCRFGFLLVLSDRPGRSHVDVFQGFEEQPEIRKLVVERIARPVIAEGSPLLVKDTTREARYAELTNHAAQVGSVAIFPLAGAARPIGVVGLMTAPEEPRLSEDDLGFLSVAGTMMHGVLNEATSRRANLHLLTRMVRPLTAALEARDPYTRGHSERVAKYALAVVHELEMAGSIEFSEEFRVTVRLAAFLHDIGKIGVSDTILQKPGNLTQEEFEIIKTHTLKGAQILDGLSELSDVVPGVVSHHERWNGTGYPHGLKGAEIPLLGKVIGISDALDAMITDRPYKKGIPIDDAMKTLRGLAGSQFDPEIVTALAAAHRSGLLEEDRSDDEALAMADGDYLAIEKIFSREIHDLPALPQIITQVLERTRDPKTPVREIVRLVSRDQALVIRILRLVNSAYYGFSRKIATINLAVAILGYRAVQNLVLNVGVVGVFREIMRSRNERRVALFEHSMECAVLAKTLALKLPSLDVQQDEAFTAGLLHDIGKIVLEQYAKDAAAQVSAVMAEKGVTELQAEAEVLGVDHASIGEWIAMRWNIPTRLREAILYHHKPFAALEQAPTVFNLVKVIALANRLYYLTREVSTPDELVAGLAMSSLSEPSLTPELVTEILKAVEVEKREFRDILSAGDAKPER